MIFPVIALLIIATLIVYRLLATTIPMDDEFWYALHRTDTRMCHAIFRMARRPSSIRQVGRQERFYRVLLVILNTAVFAWVVFGLVHRLRLEGVEDALANGVGPAVAWLVTAHWVRLDMMHSRLEAARRYLQSKGEIPQDPP